MEEFRSSITPVLTVRDAAQAIVFYGRAFGAEEIYRNTYPDGTIVAEMAVEGARFRVADEAPESANLSSQTLDGTTVRINLLVADPFGHHWLIGRPLAGKAGAWARGAGH